MTVTEKIIRRLADIEINEGCLPASIVVSKEEKEQVKIEQIQRLKSQLSKYEQEHKFDLVQVAGITLIVDGE